MVYVSGAPGSGKTTLAAQLSAALYIPHVSSDVVHGGVRLTHGEPNDRYVPFHESFVPLMIDMTKLNISFVVDHVLQEGRSKKDVIDKLSPHASIVYIHAQTKDPIARHLARELTRTDRGRVLDEVGLRARAEFHTSNLANTAQALDIGIDKYVVDTSNGYTPHLNDILDYIEKTYERSTHAKTH